MTKQIVRALCAVFIVSFASVGCETMDSCLDGTCNSSSSSSEMPTNVAIPTPPPADGQVYQQ